MLWMFSTTLDLITYFSTVQSDQLQPTAGKGFLKDFMKIFLTSIATDNKVCVFRQPTSQSHTTKN